MAVSATPVSWSLAPALFPDGAQTEAEEAVTYAARGLAMAVALPSLFGLAALTEATEAMDRWSPGSAKAPPIRCSAMTMLEAVGALARSLRGVDGLPTDACMMADVVYMKAGIVTIVWSLSHVVPTLKRSLMEAARLVVCKCILLFLALDTLSVIGMVNESTGTLAFTREIHVIVMLPGLMCIMGVTGMGGRVGREGITGAILTASMTLWAEINGPQAVTGTGAVMSSEGHRGEAEAGCVLCPLARYQVVAGRVLKLFKTDMRLYPMNGTDLKCMAVGVLAVVCARIRTSGALMLPLTIPAEASAGGCVESRVSRRPVAMVDSSSRSSSGTARRRGAGAPASV